MLEVWHGFDSSARCHKSRILGRGDGRSPRRRSGESSAGTLDHSLPCLDVHGEGDGYLRRGANVASGVLARMVKQRPAGDTDTIPFPRMAALADAVRHLRRCQDDDGNVCFARRGPGDRAAMRLDEIPLPPGVPAPGQVG